MCNGDLPPSNSFPAHWSTLSHIWLHGVCIALATWYSFIRDVPNLEAAYLDIWKTTNMDFDFPAPCTHSHLRKLVINFHYTFDHWQADEIAPSSLFLNLNLPCVDIFSFFFTSNMTWRSIATLAELSLIFQTAPNITTLGINVDFFVYGRGPEGEEGFVPSQIQEPVWESLRNLSHFQLGMGEAQDDGEDLPFLLQGLFFTM